jgi:hypothetical protein
LAENFKMGATQKVTREKNRNETQIKYNFAIYVSPRERYITQTCRKIAGEIRLFCTNILKAWTKHSYCV